MLAPADEVGILGVETVHQGVIVVGGMLGHLFDKGGIVERENLVELPGLGGGLEHQAGAVGGAVDRPVYRRLQTVGSRAVRRAAGGVLCRMVSVISNRASIVS